jgi:IMP dehydrogenase
MRMNPMDMFSAEALTFDDLLLVPGFAEVLPSGVSLKTPLHEKLHLNIPVLSAAMDTVTEAALAIATSAPKIRPPKWIRSSAASQA